MRSYDLEDLVAKRLADAQQTAVKVGTPSLAEAAGASLAFEHKIRRDDRAVLLRAELDLDDAGNGRTRASEYFFAGHHDLGGLPGLAQQNQGHRLEIDQVYPDGDRLPVSRRRLDCVQPQDRRRAMETHLRTDLVMAALGDGDRSAQAERCHPPQRPESDQYTALAAQYDEPKRKAGAMPRSRYVVHCLTTEIAHAL